MNFYMLLDPVILAFLGIRTRYWLIISVVVVVLLILAAWARNRSAV